ncbi:transcription antitermination factor NusB [Gammaproteobacteria bacterium]|nr:transcription antitermination factor NusB [Gammaproteobacteria bacterium]
MTEAPAVPKIAHRKKARNLLVQALYQWQLSDNPLAEIEAQYRADNTGKVDWDFFHEAFAFIPANLAELDKIFESYLDRDIEQLNPIELAVLRLGSFELLKRIDVPYKVVINEYVDLTKKYGATESHKYVNGVLDKAARQLRSIELGAK